MEMKMHIVMGKEIENGDDVDMESKKGNVNWNRNRN